MSDSLYKLGLTHGDFNGVGYEVILKTLSDERMGELFVPIVYGTKQLFDYYKRLLEVEIPLPVHVIRTPQDARPGTVSIIECGRGRDARPDITPGISSGESGLYAVLALERARADLDAGLLDGVVTAPIHKETAHGVTLSDGVEVFPEGHTEFFAHTHPEEKPMMLFTNRTGLQVGLLTIHIPLSEVSAAVTREGIINAARRLERILKVDFAVDKPRIALLGLNPHAGENGLMGTEEEQVLKPAVKDLWETGMLFFGPYPADGFWGNAAWQKFDGVLALYHDQGLIPFKMMAMNDGVNVTAGLSVVRTSPDHGTAFDIAGKGVADPGSFRAAVYQAIDIIDKRKDYAEHTSNPLPLNAGHRRREGREFD